MASLISRNNSVLITSVFGFIMVAYIARVYAGIQRAATWRTGFMELGRFPDCGVNATPVAEHTAFTQSHCGIRCIEDTRCVSYEYVTENKTCFLHDVSAIENLITKDGYTYADSTDPVQVGEVHPCQQSYCSEGNVCIEECAPNGFTCECPDGYFGRFCDKLIPVDGGFAPWGNWSECNEICRAMRYRNCTNPARVSTGADCVGPNTDVITCSTEQCQVYPYMGCFHQSAFDNKGLRSVLTNVNMTLEICVDKCSALGYKYAAIQNDECRCRRHDPLPQITEELGCSTICPGNANQTCGDVNNYVSVYATGGFYQGCFTGNMSTAMVLIEPEFFEHLHTTASMTTFETTTEQSTEATTTDQTTYQTTTQDNYPTTRAPQQTESGITNNENIDNVTMSGGDGTHLGSTRQGAETTTSISPSTESPTTTDGVTTREPTTTESQTTAESQTASPHLTLTVADCISGCEIRGYLYAWLFNASYCMCHNTIRHLERSNGGCNAPCPGDDGMVCGGDATISVYRINPHGIGHWTAWYNNHYPYTDGGDYEDPEEIRTAEPWICDEPVDAQCREFATGQTNEEIGDVFETPCSVDKGFNCTAEMQTYYVNVTFDLIKYRIVDVQMEVNLTELNCTFVSQNLDATTPSPLSQTGNVTSTTGSEGRASTSTPSSPFDSTAGADVGTTGQLYNTNNVTMENATQQSDLLTTVHPDDLLNIECTNVTVSKIESMQVNESYITLGWRVDAVLKQCQDYRMRFLCPNARGKLIGCYSEGSLNGFIPNTTMEINPVNCTSLCRESGYRYAGIQESKSECACGNVFTDSPTFAQACSARCGDNNYPCGGISSQSIYFSDCDMPFNVDNTSMRGTPMHTNEGTDEYETWFGGFTDNTTVYLKNFTNIGQQLSFKLYVDLGEIRPVTKLITSGIFVEGADVMTGATTFRAAYRVYEDDQLEFIKSSSLDSRVFTADDLSAKSEHELGNVIELQYLQIFVDSYYYFPGILLDLHGCAS